MNYLNVDNFNFFQRLGVLCIILMIAAFCTIPQIMILYILMGYAHFALSFYYKYKKTDITLKIIIYHTALLLFFYVCSYQLQGYFIIFVTLYAAIHHFYDEIFLLSEKVTSYSAGCFLPFLILTFSLNVDFFNNFQTYETLKYFIFAASAAYFIIGLIKREARFYILYVSFITIGSLFLFHLFSVPHPTIFFGSLIIAHYMYWYITMGKRIWMSKNKLEFKKYGLLVALSNIAIVILFITLNQNENLKEIGDVLFSPYAFFAWTAWHVTTSIRYDDYKKSLPQFLRYRKGN